MDLREYIRILHKNWLLISAMTLLGLLGGAIVSVIDTPQYQARMQLYVSIRNETQASDNLVQGSTFVKQSVQSYANILSSEIVLAPVMEELGISGTVTALADRVTASIPLNTSIIEVQAIDQNPVRAAEIANAAGKSLTNVVQDQLEAGDSPDVASPVKLTTVQTALVPRDPFSPRLELNLAVGLLLGMIAGITIAALRTLLDTRVRTLQDIEQITDAPMLGGIPFDDTVKSRPLIVQADSRHPRAESFRKLRTNLSFIAANENSDSRGRSFVISSATPGEGKSTTTSNLAIALAETGARVALIDADLRLPKIAEYMGIEGGAGLSEVLIGRASASDVLQRWGANQLFVMPAGRIPPNPSELLGSGAMAALLDLLHTHFDYVLIDTPPLLLVTDATVAAQHTNGVILVVASGATRRPEFDMAVKTLNAAGGALRGFIVTKLPTKGPDSEAYGFGHGTYYGAASSRPDAAPTADPVATRRARRAEDRRHRPRRQRETQDPHPLDTPAPSYSEPAMPPHDDATTTAALTLRDPAADTPARTPREQVSDTVAPTLLDQVTVTAPSTQSVQIALPAQLKPLQRRELRRENRERSRDHREQPLTQAPKQRPRASDRRGGSRHGRAMAEIEAPQ
ncbi:polysaccharide biosynthesis tyrosine autokinase [Leucobacter sp. USHLN153]|uniref:polysaccharide biosynthesis tyrosine autokinase n=1 Tax=Leucobacter sp. USHLN153 TaxID=3081268 RepID=UPI00301A8ED9